MDTCERAVEEKFTVDIRPVRFNYLGVARSGKTSFRLRLSGMIVDISWVEKVVGQSVQPSTGVAEDGGHIMIQVKCLDTGIISSYEWSAFKDLSQEAAMLSQLLCQELCIESPANLLHSVTQTPSTDSRLQASPDYLPANPDPSAAITAPSDGRRHNMHSVYQAPRADIEEVSLPKL